MDQSGVYFTLDAPHVSIIGLYSNVLEAPGVISTQGGHHTAINDDQLTFLTEELTRLRPEAQAGTRAVLLAVHHPPASAEAKHGGGAGLAPDIERLRREGRLVARRGPLRPCAPLPAVHADHPRQDAADPLRRLGRRESGLAVHESPRVRRSATRGDFDTLSGAHIPTGPLSLDAWGL